MPALPAAAAATRWYARRLAIASLLVGSSIACLDPSLPVYTFEQTDSSHPGYRRSTIVSAGASYVNDFEEQSLQLIDVEPKKIIGRSRFGDGRICAIEGQDPAAYVAVDVGSEMPAYEVFRGAARPPFDWRHAAFQRMRLAILLGPAANKETTDAALIEDVLRTLRDGVPADPPLASLQRPISAAADGIAGVLLVSDRIPGLMFRPSCYISPAGEVYLAEGIAVTYSRTEQTVRAAWIPASQAFTRWATTP